MDHKNKHLHPIFEEVNSVFSSHHVAATLKTGRDPLLNCCTVTFQSWSSLKQGATRYLFKELRMGWQNYLVIYN